MTLANVWKHHSFETTSLRILPGFSLLKPCPGYTVRCLFVIRNISISLSLSVCPQIFGFMFKDRVGQERTSWLQRGQWWLLQVSVPQRYWERKSVHLPVWVCVIWGFCRVGHTRVPRWCWMCVIVTQLRDMGSCGEICPQPSSCLSICWNVVAECCGWLLLPIVFYLQPILLSLFTEWPRHTGVANATEKGGWLVKSVQLSAVALNLI